MTVESEQDELLSSALQIVQEQSLKIKESLDDTNRLGVLKAFSHASIMLATLRTSQLSPKTYYQLYMAIAEELRYLSDHLNNDFKKGLDIVTYYTEVQYFSNIVPRLYLLITIGRTCMLTNPSTIQPLLRDLVEMCRGVQHPLRGLFLRNYLLHCVREILPTLLEPESNSWQTKVRDSIDFILVNFAEMNKLWVRMQHQGHSREREKREREREQLKLLVGTNLVRLSELENITIENYSKLVLPGILEQVVSCKDAISQEYLMDCIIQVFPAENHVATFGPFLKSCSKLHSDVNVKTIVISLTERLTSHFTQDEEKLSQLFQVFSDHVDNFVQNREGLAIQDIIQIEVSLMNMALKCYPDHYDFVDKVLQATLLSFNRLQITRVDHTEEVTKELRRLLSIPVLHYNNILTVLKLSYYVPLLRVLDLAGRKAMATVIINNVFINTTLIPTPHLVSNVLGMLSSVIYDPRRSSRNKKRQDEVEDEDFEDEVGDNRLGDDSDDVSSEPEEDDLGRGRGGMEDALYMDPDDFAEEQGLLARFIHHLKSEDPDEQKEILLLAKKHFLRGGRERIKFTLPPIIFQAFQLAFKYCSIKDKDPEWDIKCAGLLQMCYDTIGILSAAGSCELALKLYLQATLAIGNIRYTGYETAAYQFFTQGFVVYEEEVSNCKTQLGALTLLVATLYQLDCLSESSMKTAIKHCTNAASTLLKLADQCRGGLTTAHLFWRQTEKDPQGVLDCLMKAVKTSAKIIDKLIQAQLLVELLNYFLYFNEKGNSLVSTSSISQLKTVVVDGLSNLESCEESEQISKHLANTLEHAAELKIATTDDQQISSKQLKHEIIAAFVDKRKL